RSCVSPGESSLPAAAETVLAFAGGEVLLPCSFNISAGGDFPTVEWSKHGLQPNIVFLYRDGCETHEMKNPAFWYRSSLITRELKNGNISLRISDVQLADAGKYQCKRLWSKTRRDVTDVELVVAAVSEPKLSVVSSEGGGVTLQCEASCWLPEPEIIFLDDRGRIISAEEPKRDKDTGQCFTVRRRVTLQDAPNRVTCRVHQAATNQSHDTELLLPVGRSCYVTFLPLLYSLLYSLSYCSCVESFSFCGRNVAKLRGRRL
ncbi:putative selection and upkeep of intraepithelial T-cells protein 1 homolog, partial [Cottoperca gobio]|uniref:Selection and upkeep of intraepithelial T-cells protein 1 homolog n=1 Tax=Cottoperca gobio TaxID=56716 RepID=A0A6J2PC97_COTGO